MSFTVKFRGDRSAAMICAYTCPEHGEFDAEVRRDDSGSPPDVVPCPVGDPLGGCSLVATWTPSPIACSVRRIEAVKGNWEKPERKTYLDTRELAEGQDMDEFRAKRSAIWDEKRKAEVMAFKRGF